MSKRSEENGWDEVVTFQPVPLRVYNRRRGLVPKTAIYVGRPTQWGNPFTIGRDGDRAQVIAKFRTWVHQPEQESLRTSAKRELRGRDLVCWCAPEDCHAYVWLEIVNE